MARDEKEKTPDKRGRPVTPEDKATWGAQTREAGRGGTSARDTAAPREKEASQEPGTRVARGFTSTGPSGSAGGRKTYGNVENEEEEG